MDSVGTKSYRQRSSETLGFDAPAPHIVVVCPSCKTSFAVETAAVAALETPRFHCSRCDDIFVMKDAPADMLPLGGVQVQSITKPAPLARNSATRGRGALPESLIKSSDFSLGNETTPPRSFIEPEQSTIAAPATAIRSEMSLLNKSVDEPFEESLSTDESVEWEESFQPSSYEDLDNAPANEMVSNSARTESAATNLEGFARTNVGQSGFLVAPSTATPTTQTLSSRQFVLSDPPPVLGTPNQLPPETPAKQAPKQPVPERTKAPQPLRAPLSQSEQTIKTETYRPSPPPRRAESGASDRANPQGRFSIRMQSLISMSTPIIGTLALLLGISYCARLSPHSIDALAQVLTPRFIQEPSLALPPKVLAVRDLKLSFEKTRNKEIVPVARGVVANDSTRAFDDVELEVLGFNGRGEIIASSRAPLRSALNNEKVPNLPLDAVRRYQSTLSAKSSVIGGQERVPFAIALLDGRYGSREGEPAQFDPSQIRYFSARIFSVKR